MSSGYFPMNNTDRGAKELLRAALIVRKLISNVWESVCSGDDGQFDNAAYDGGSLARLELAVNLIVGEVNITEHMSDCAIHNEPALPKGKCDCWEGAPSFP